MKLLELVRRESSLSLVKLATIAGIAGISSALVLAIINTAAEEASNDEHSFLYLAMFGTVVALYFFSQKYILVTSTAEVERILDRVRVRMADLIRRSDLRPLEQLGRADIYTSISRDTVIISQATGPLVASGQYAILIIFALMYVAWLSLTAVLITLGFLGLATVIHMHRSRKINEELQESIRRDNMMFDAMTGFLDGFKQVRLHAPRSDDLFEDAQEVSEGVRDLKSRVMVNFAEQLINSQIMLFLLLATTVFLVPRLSDTLSDDLVKITTAILFIVGPVGSVVGAVQIYANATAAAENIAQLEDKLSQNVQKATKVMRRFDAFQQIVLDGVYFRYQNGNDTAQFAVGPVDLTLNSGEMVFISGGNGSGKSTFLKIFTGLYYPSQGSIRVDKYTLGPSNYETYRNLISAVFTDFHLFPRLYGLGDHDPERFEELLEDMELVGKTELVDGRFDTLALSTGQRKRLALMISLLEDRPLYVFDEWAADQDPIFRRKFYEKILPDLKKRGKTIVAVTHDDHYYHVADRTLKMDYGRFLTSAEKSAASEDKVMQV